MSGFFPLRRLDACAHHDHHTHEKERQGGKDVGDAGSGLHVEIVYLGKKCALNNERMVV
jgi:hypothetical protein